MHKEWLLRHRQRHLLCSILHPKATCGFTNIARCSHIRMDALWDFPKFYLNKFILSSTFDGVSNQTITWFFWVPVNSTVSMYVFHLSICFDLHLCHFFPLAPARLSSFADSLAVAQPLPSMLTSGLDQNSCGGDYQLMLPSKSVLALQCCSETSSETKIANTLSQQLKVVSPFTRFNYIIQRVMRIRLLKIWL